MRWPRRWFALTTFGVAGSVSCQNITRQPLDEAESVTTVRGQAPETATDHLTLAAACMDRGDDAGALPHLAAHVSANPQAVMIRAYLAELHHRLGNTAEARGQYERFIHDVSNKAGAIREHLVHAHTRLMEIAQTNDDNFEIHLRRGIGLVLLVRQWETQQLQPEDAPAEATLVKAAAALRTARDERPDDPRPHLYLAEVYSRLGQPSAARSAALAANAAGPAVGVRQAEELEVRR